MENLVHTTPTQGDRFIGILIDGFIAGAITAVVTLIPFIGAIGSILGLSYYLLRDALPFFDGQSVGKNLMKLKVIKESTGESIKGDYMASITRNVSLFIPFYDALLILGVVGPKDGKRLGDTWAGTKVIKIV